MTKISEIKQQRPDRISLILNKLEQNLKWIKEFLTFVRIINNEDVD